MANQVIAAASCRHLRDLAAASPDRYLPRALPARTRPIPAYHAKGEHYLKSLSLHVPSDRLASLQRSDLFGDGHEEAMHRLLATVAQRHSGRPSHGYLVDNLGAYLKYSGLEPPEVEQIKYRLSDTAKRMIECGEYIEAAENKLENAHICRLQSQAEDAYDLEISARALIGEAAQRGQYLAAARALRNWASDLRKEGHEKDAYLLEVTASQYEMRLRNAVEGSPKSSLANYSYCPQPPIPISAQGL